MPKTIKPVAYPKSFESKFIKLTETMTDLMAKQYFNETIKKLNKSTVDKFSDKQYGSYGKIFLTLSKKSKRKLMKRFSDERIDKAVSDILMQLNTSNQKAFYKNVEEEIGIDVKQLIYQEKLKGDIQSLILETQEWVKTLRDDNLKYFNNNVLRAMTQNKSLDEVISEFDMNYRKRKNYAKFIARNQIANYNGMLSKVRAESFGIDKAVWVTSRDERVRSSHVDRDKKEFDLSVGLYSEIDKKTLLPGTDYQCRCIYRFVLPD